MSDNVIYLKLLKPARRSAIEPLALPIKQPSAVAGGARKRAAADVASGEASAATSATAEKSPIVHPFAPLEIIELCSDELRCSPARYVYIDADENAHSHNPWKNVMRRATEEGGRPLFGRKFLCSELVTAVKFHVVLERNDGSLIDPTPAPGCGHFSAFAPDRSIPTDFPWEDRPSDYRFANHVLPSRATYVADGLAEMSEAERSRLRASATAVGITEEDYAAFEFPVDPLATAIDRYIDAADAFDAAEACIATEYVEVDELYLPTLKERVTKLKKLMEDLWVARKARL